MDELASKCSLLGRVVRSDYRNTYDHKIRSLRYLFSSRGSRRIAAEWKRLDPEVVHVNKQNLEDGLDLLQASQLCGIPCICTIHLTQTARYLGARAAALRDLIARRALKRFEGPIVTVQPNRQAELDCLVAGKARTKTILNGVPLVDRRALSHVREQKRAELGLTQGHFLVLGVGRLVPQKRPLLFLETARELHRRLPNTLFKWVGDGELRHEWQRWVGRAQLSDVISCEGWQEEVLPYLLAADALLHVAEYEGLPFAIIEALAAGLPCILPRSLQRDFGLFDSTSVLIFDEPAELVPQLRDVSGLRTLAVNARRLVADRLSIAAMAVAYEEVYLREVTV